MGSRRAICTSRAPARIPRRSRVPEAFGPVTIPDPSTGSTFRCPIDLDPS
jgi:hypothetical protein